MATTIVTKYGSDAPAASDLVRGELAVDTENGRLYTENSSGAVVEIGLNPEGNVDVTGSVTADKLITDSGVDAASFTSTGSTYVDINNGTVTGRLQTISSDFFIGTATVGTSLAFKSGNNVEAMRIDSSGKVMVGTSVAPHQKLTVTGASGSADGVLSNGILALTTGTGVLADTRLLMGIVDDSYAWLQAADYGVAYRDIVLNPNGGNIGIGTASPSFITGSGLEIQRTTADATLRLEHTGANAFELSTESTQVTYNSVSSKPHVFEVGSAAKMTIAADGSVGIGTDSPSAGAVGGTVVHVQNSGGTASVRVDRSDAATSGTLSMTSGNTSNSLFGTGAKPMTFATDSTERMRIDSSGNLNVSRSAYTSASTDGFHANASGWTHTSVSNEPVAYFNRNTSDGDVIRVLKAGSHVGSIGSAAGDKMSVIGTNQNLQIGANGANVFNVSTTSVYPATDNATDLGFSSSIRWKDLYLSGNAYADNFIGTNDGDTFIAMTGSNVMRFFTGNSEAARFDNSGTFLVGKSSGAASDDGHQIFGTGQHYYYSTATEVQRFYETTTQNQVGSIAITTSATTYATSSDQRLKDNIVDAPSASDDIDAIQVRSFDWKADGSHQKYGMVAQELQTVAPEAVSAPEDPEEMMGVDYSKLVPMMLKEIQSLRARVAQLES